MSFSIDWQRALKSIVDLGSESYEQKMTRTMITGALLGLILIIAWKVMK